jgi:peptidyl-prolyl cis-trans isomerase D
MLQSIREKTSGWIASIILGVIILIMSMFGMQQYLVPKVETYAAKIESAPAFWIFGKKTREVSVDEFRRRFEQIRQQQRAEQGEQFDPVAFETADNKRLVLDRLVDEAVLELVAEREGLVVSTAQVRKTIAELPSFQENGKFDKDRYLAALQAQGMTTGGFERLVRSSLLQQQVPDEIAASAMFGDAELDAFLRLSGQTRHVRFLEVPAPTEPAPPPTDAQIKAWYDAHQSEYRTPEQVSIDYIELLGSDLPVAAAPSEDELRKRYQAEITRFGAPDQRLVSHILVAVPANAPASAWSAAQAKAVAIAARARAPGADFAALARELSEDVGTKADGGDLGDIAALDDNDPATPTNPLVAAAASLQPGQVSDPVRSESGWHVLQFRELVKGSAKPFEEVRATLEAEFADSERERAFNDASGELIDAIYASPASLATVAAKVKLPVRKASNFSATDGTGIAALPLVRKAAFEDDQKLERQVSDPIEIADDHEVVLQVTDLKPAAVQPLAQVRDRVASDIVADRIVKATQARADALLKRVRAGESLDAIATEVGRTITDVPTMGRNPPAPQVAPLVEAAFALPRPAPGKMESTVAKMGAGQPALVVVDSVTDGDIKALDKDARANLLQRITAARGNEDARAFIQALRKQYTIIVAEDRL